jgi:hypothetical protein
MLEENNTYSTIRTSLIDTMSQNDTQREEIFNEMITEDWVRNKTDTLIINFLAYIRSDTDTLNLTIYIDGRNLSRTFLNKIVFSQLGNITTCQPGQEPDFTTGLPGCLPADMSREEFVAVFLETQNISIEDVEQMFTLELDLVEMAGPEALESLQGVRNSIQQGFFLLNVVIGLLIAILISIILLTFHSIKSMLKWVGTTFLVSGSVCFISALILIMSLKNAIPGNLGGLERLPEINNLVYDLIFRLMSTVLDEVKLYSGIFLIHGAVMVIVSVMVRERPLLKTK